MSIRNFVCTIALLWLFIPAISHAQLNAATLPSSRAVATNEMATFFATILNANATEVTNCQIGLSFTAPAGMSIGYQTTDATNNLIGTTDTPANIAAGGAQNYLVRITSTAVYNGKIPLTFNCAEGSAVSFNAVNQPDLRVTVAPGPDIIALGATISGDGIVNVNPDNLLGAMSISAINVGAAAIAGASHGKAGPAANEASITVSGETVDFLLDNQITVQVCETDALSNCLSPLAASVTTNIGDGGATFSAFVVKDPVLALPFFPSHFRLKINFKGPGGELLGSTSAALNSPETASASDKPVGAWELIVRDDSDPASDFERRGLLMIPEGNDPIFGWIMREDFSTFPSKMIAQPIRMTGTFDLNAKTFTGVMDFVAKGTVPAASPNVVMNYSNGKSLFFTYDGSNTPDAPQGKSDNKPSIPLINPVSGRGLLFAKMAWAQDSRTGSAAADAAKLDLMHTFVDSTDVSIGDLVADLGVSTFTGTFKGCTLSGSYDGSKTGLFLRASLSYTDCPDPVDNGPHTGMFFINEDLSPIISIDYRIGTGSHGLRIAPTNAVIFADGFESGDTTAWSTVLSDF